MIKVSMPLVIFLLIITGCATTQFSNLQRRNIEARELEGTFDYAFKATLQVLQDNGYVIAYSDYKAGVVKGQTGLASTRYFCFQTI